MKGFVNIFFNSRAQSDHVLHNPAVKMQATRDARLSLNSYEA